MRIGTLNAFGPEAKETFSKPAPLETTLGEKWSGHLSGIAGVLEGVERVPGRHWKGNVKIVKVTCGIVFEAKVFC